MGDGMPSAKEDCEQINKMWEWISEFVCWEFCKHNAYEACGETDLVDFFRSMVIKKASKEMEQVQACEAVAKFIEVANITASERNSFEFLNQYAKLVVRNVHHLQPITESLIEEIEDYLENDDLENEQTKLLASIQEFSKEAFRSLPYPSLLKMKKENLTNCNSDEKIVPSTQQLITVLKKITLCEDAIVDIRSRIQEDKLFQHILEKAISNKSDSQNEDADASSSSQELRICDERGDAKRSSEPTNNTTSEKNKKAEKKELESNKNSDAAEVQKTGSTEEDFNSSLPSVIKPLPKRLLRTSSMASLQSDSSMNQSTKRQRNYWTDQEEETLVKGVKTYGTGFWSLIRADGGLEKRSVRDLYDKWKNIQKYKHLERIEKRLLDKEKQKHHRKKT